LWWIILYLSAVLVIVGLVPEFKKIHFDWQHKCIRIWILCHVNCYRWVCVPAVHQWWHVHTRGEHLLVPVPTRLQRHLLRDLQQPLPVAQLWRHRQQCRVCWRLQQQSAALSLQPWLRLRLVMYDWPPFDSVTLIKLMRLKTMHWMVSQVLSYL